MSNCQKAYTEALQDALFKNRLWRSPRENVSRFGWQEVCLLYDRAVRHTIDRLYLGKRAKI